MYILPGALAPLANCRQFILVQFIPRGDSGKMDKIPVSPHTYAPHNAHDATIWLSLADATRIAASLGTGWGVGVVLTDADPYICLDLDQCAEGGGWNDNAQRMMAAFPGAIELSNSGKGLHIWATYQGVAPPHCKRAPKIAGVDPHMELYTGKRFIALGSTATGYMGDVTALLPAFIALYFPPSATSDAVLVDGIDPEYTPIDDADLLRRALDQPKRHDASATFTNVPTMANFVDLWTRDVSVLRHVYPPQMTGKDINASDADAALAKELAYWTGRDAPRIERLMRQSALMRDKWDSHRTYLRDTVANGLSRCTSVFKGAPKSVALPGAAEGFIAPLAITHATNIGREDMAKLFAGCVYIQDDNAVLLPNGDIVDQPRFKARYAGYTFAMDNDNLKSSRDSWDAFLNNSVITFPRVDGSAFDPQLPFQAVIVRGGRNWINTYKKPFVKMRKGDVTRFLMLLKKLLPNGDDALILLCYMAAIVQYPGVKFRYAPFLQGTPGNGKSTIVQCLKYALGYTYIFSVKAGMIENNFNAWLENHVLFIADDIYSTKDRTDMMEALKSMITEQDHGVTRKGIDSIQKRICGNFFFTDNHKDAMKKTDDSRRLCTLYCAQQSKQDRMRDGLTKEYFTGSDGLISWLEREGFEFVAEFLHTFPIDPRYNPAGECQEAPDTSATSEAIIDGRTGIEHDVAEWIELREPGFCGGFVSATMLKKKMEGARSMGYLKIKEMMLRLGYEVHRGLPGGRCNIDVQPDGTRPVLYVLRDSAAANMVGAAEITKLYVDTQMTALVEKRFAS